MALVPHLGGVGEYVILIWERSDHDQEPGDLHTLAATFIMWGEIMLSRLEKGKINREIPKRETHGPMVRRYWWKAYVPTVSQMPA